MDLTFAQPVWLWGLLALVVPVLLRIRAQLRGSNHLPGLVSPRLRHRLVTGASEALRWTWHLCLLAALAFVILALARPQWGTEVVETESRGRNLIIAIDTSRSMLANDLVPNRLDRAKLAAKDIILNMPEDRIGLIAFAGRAFLQAPLTVDHDAVFEAIDQMDTELIPRGGTNLSAAVELALETFAEADLDQSALILFSDGEALEGAQQVDRLVEQAREARMTIITIGAGTEAGAIIPELDETGNPRPGVFVKDESGQVVRTRLDTTALRNLASRGAYLPLGGGNSLTSVVRRIVATLDATRSEDQTRERPIERFVWPLGAALVLATLGFLLPLLPVSSRRKSPPPLPAMARVTALAGCLAAFTPVHATATDATTRGYEAFREGDYRRSLDAYQEALRDNPRPRQKTRIHLGIGSAAYEKGDYEKAAESFGEALLHPDRKLREVAHYNLGNTLFRSGELQLQGGAADPDRPRPMTAGGPSLEATIEQWQTAIAHYESALELNARNKHAKRNIEVVKRKLDELEEQQQEQQQDQQNQDQQNQDQQNQDQQNQDQQDQDQQDQDQQNQDQQNQDQQNQDQQNQDQQNQDQQNQDQQNQDQQNQDQQNQDQQDQDQQDQEEPDLDGELEANPNEAQPGEESPGQQAREQEVNPETGYSPSEARQLLRALADETEVRPLLERSRDENYKNW